MLNWLTGDNRTLLFHFSKALSYFFYSFCARS